MSYETTTATLEAEPSLPVMESRLLARLGVMPNLEDFQTDEKLMDVSVFQSLDISGDVVTRSAGDTSASLHVVDKLTPAVLMAANHWRSLKSDGDELRALVGYTNKVATRLTSTRADKPHTDYARDGDKVFYLGAIGATTRVYEANFPKHPDISPLTPLEQAWFQEYINEHDIQPLDLASGEVIALNARTVHQTPDKEDVIGHRRGVLLISLESQT